MGAKVIAPLLPTFKGEKRVPDAEREEGMLLERGAVGERLAVEGLEERDGDPERLSLRVAPQSRRIAQLVGAQEGDDAADREHARRGRRAVAADHALQQGVDRRGLAAGQTDHGEILGR